MGGSLAFHFSCLSHVASLRVCANFRPRPGDPVGPSAPRSSDGGGAGASCSLQRRQRLAFNQRAPRRPSTRQAQPIIAAFPFLPSPNLAHGCCRRVQNKSASCRPPLPPLPLSLPPPVYLPAAYDASPLSVMLSVASSCFHLSVLLLYLPLSLTPPCRRAVGKRWIFKAQTAGDHKLTQN